MSKLYELLHIAGGLFPTGGFSQSWGLETYVFHGKIRGEKDFQQFLEIYIRHVLQTLEGPFFSDTYDAVALGKLESVPKLEETFSAMRLTRETREMSYRTGKAFLRVMAEISDDKVVKHYYEEQKEIGISFPMAFSLICARRGIDKKDALRAYFFNSVNGLVQSGLKLIPLGNMQAQKILQNMYDHIESAVNYAVVTPSKEANAFCPGLDIASMEHEVLPTRLYMT